MVNQKTLDLIKKYEGLRLKAYKDTGGVWTIGYGHTSDDYFPVNSKSRITAEKAEELLAHDLKEAEAAVDRLVKVPMNANQRGALVSFTYNLGEGQVSESTLLKKLNAGDYASVPAQMKRWVYDDGVKLRGLVRRRADEALLWKDYQVKLPEEPTKMTILELLWDALTWFFQRH